MRAGLFVSFEGADGSGKSTQIYLLRDALAKQGIEAVITREPGGTTIGEKIRNIILDTANDRMSDVTEMLLYAASRAQHVDEVIRPCLEAGKTVISDRFVDSSIAYQGYARGLGDMVQKTNAYAVREYMPDITFFLRTGADSAYSRIEKGSEDRIEAEGLWMQRRVAEAYEELAETQSDRIVVIDASQSIEDIHKEIMGYMTAIYSGGYGSGS